jgi:hypothetical protein
VSNILEAKKVGREIAQVEALLGRVIEDRYHEDISKGLRKESAILWKKADAMRGRDLKRAFDLMYRHIWGWWD